MFGLEICLSPANISGSGYGIFNGFGTPDEIARTTLNTGDGNDTITGIGAYAIINYATINTGEGADSIIGDASSNNGPGEGIINVGTINTGNGANSIISEGKIINYGGVYLGNGNDLISADTDFLGLALENFNVIETGEGNDTISSLGDLYNEGVIETGEGDDEISGSGDLFYNEGIINTGDGNDSIYSRFIYNNGGAIITGDGKDSIYTSEGFESGPNSSGAWFLGEDDDYLHGFGSGDFYGGNGRDIINFGQAPGSYTVGIWGEGQDRSVVLTKGNQQMIISEFEVIFGPSTGYNLASLIPGQIIDIF